MASLWKTFKNKLRRCYITQKLARELIDHRSMCHGNPHFLPTAILSRPPVDPPPDRLFKLIPLLTYWFSSKSHTTSIDIDVPKSSYVQTTVIYMLQSAGREVGTIHILPINHFHSDIVSNLAMTRQQG